MPRDKDHIVAAGTDHVSGFTPKGRPRARPAPARIRDQHGRRLENEIAGAVATARQQIAARDPAIARGTPGFYLEFSTNEGQEALLSKLENHPKKIELVAVKRTDDDAPLKATVFVPEAAADFYLQRVTDYRTKNTVYKGEETDNPKNRDLVERIEKVRLGDLLSIFTDPANLFPQTNDPIWWEVWLRHEKLESFNAIAEDLALVRQAGNLSFAERDVVLVHASRGQLARLVSNSDCVAEIKIASDVPSFFLDMETDDQNEWADDFVERLIDPDPAAPAVCLLDSGVNFNHPMLEPVKAPETPLTVNAAWGTDDTDAWNGHGSNMAGVAAYGDMIVPLSSQGGISSGIWLESVRILPETDQNDPHLYGSIVEQAVARAEIAAPERKRVVCMAVTSDAEHRTGKPSSWSAAIDQLAVGDPDPRMVILAAGNYREAIDVAGYPDINSIYDVENPGQAWNAVTVGGMTNKSAVGDGEYAEYEPLAPVGGLSPRSRTSVSWDREWPIKPDIVCEAGNHGVNGAGNADAIDPLQLVSTHHRPNLRLFDAFGDTSAAAAEAARIAAKISAKYPEFPAETVRGLLIHSAQYTPAMQNDLDQCADQQGKRLFLRKYGYGVPSLGRALFSAENDATMIIQSSIQPFTEGASIKLNEFNLHSLPWPREQLAELGETDTMVRITLSYFVEPNPGERGWSQKHYYQSHGLRFKFKKAGELNEQFIARITKVDDEEEAIAPARGGNAWQLGLARDRGSVHSDTWTGLAADLADQDSIAVYPVSGWWKTKKAADKYNNRAPYSLIVSISAAADVDLYAPIMIEAGIPVEIQV